jgi:peptidoglycan/LPS O-acetylase OafA/YrhL
MAAASAPAGGREVFHTLDAMRGLLALIIVYWHVGASPHAEPKLSLQLAVDVFFVLSGFVVAHAYADRMPGLGASRLILIRLIRLYPLFLLGFVISVVCAEVRNSARLDEAPIWQLWPNALMLPTLPHTPQWELFGVLAFFPLNIPGWSLTAEMLVNIVFALVWMIVRPGLRTLAAIVAIAAAALLASAFYYGNLDIGWGWSTAPGLLTRVAFGFPAGVLLQRLYAQGVRAPRLPGWLLLASLGALLLAVRAPEQWRAGWESFFVIVLCPLYVWLGASATGGRVGDWLGAASARLSYAIYAIHYPIMRLLIDLCRRFWDVEAGRVPIFVGGLLCVAVLAAWAADALYDRPIRRWLTRVFLSGKAPKGAETTSKTA